MESIIRLGGWETAINRQGKGSTASPSHLDHRCNQQPTSQIYNGESQMTTRSTIITFWATMMVSLHQLGENLRLRFLTTWAWTQAVWKSKPAYITADGRHIIRDRRSGHIYITPVPASNPLFINNPPIRRMRYWLESSAVADFIQDDYVHCPEDWRDSVVVGGTATRGCYVEGGGYDGYVIEEIGVYQQENPNLERRRRLLTVMINPDQEIKYVGFPFRFFTEPPPDPLANLRTSIARPRPRGASGGNPEEIELEEWSRGRLTMADFNLRDRRSTEKEMEEALSYMIDGDEDGSRDGGQWSEIEL